VEFGGKYHLLGKYSLLGVARYESGSNEDEELCYFEQEYCYGNRILKGDVSARSEEHYGILIQSSIRNRFEFYRNNRIESICFVYVQQYEEIPEDFTLPGPDEQEFVMLLRDILG
jgi:hypothetical protein